MSYYQDSERGSRGYKGTLFNVCELCSTAIPSGHTMCRKHYLEFISNNGSDGLCVDCGEPTPGKWANLCRPCFRNHNR